MALWFPMGSTIAYLQPRRNTLPVFLSRPHSLNTGLGSRLRFFEYGIYDYEDKGLDIDIIIKDIYGKLPYGMSSGCFVYATHYYMTAEKTSNTFGSIVLFSYNVVGVTVYKCVD